MKRAGHWIEVLQRVGRAGAAKHVRCTACGLEMKWKNTRVGVPSHWEGPLLEAKECVSEAKIDRVLEVLAPGGMPIFEWGHEETPTLEEVRKLATEIVEALDRSGRRK